MGSLGYPRDVPADGFVRQDRLARAAAMMVALREDLSVLLGQLRALDAETAGEIIRKTPAGKDRSG